MGRTGMSERELRRVEVLGRVKAGELKLGSVAELLGVSYRQGKRLWKRYREEGAKGLPFGRLRAVSEAEGQHRSAGRKSQRAKPAVFREQVMRLLRSQYGGPPGERFGPTLAAEHLESDDGLAVDHETLRRWMLAEGLWSRERKRKQHRRRRERKEHFGELVQLDGSFEEWLPGSGEKPCLMNMVDDATGKTLSQLHPQETTWAAADLLRGWVEKYGVPHRLYTDWKNVYLRQHYLPDHNRRFSRTAAAAEDYHRQRPGKAALDGIFRLEEPRGVSNDGVVQYRGRWLQIERESGYAPAGSKVVVCEGRDGSLQVWYRQRPVKWREIPRPVPEAHRQPPAQDRGAPELRRNAPQPGSHPWKQWRPSWLQAQAAASATRSGPSAP